MWIEQQLTLLRGQEKNGVWGGQHLRVRLEKGVSQ